MVVAAAEAEVVVAAVSELGPLAAVAAVAGIQVARTNFDHRTAAAEVEVAAAGVLVGIVAEGSLSFVAVDHQQQEDRATVLPETDMGHSHTQVAAAAEAEAENAHNHKVQKHWGIL